MFLETIPVVHKEKRYCHRIGDRKVDFSSTVPIPSYRKNIAGWLARNLGPLKIVWYQALPAIIES